LLEVLRDDLGLVGAKEGCGVGMCGACTMLVDGKPVSGCLTLAAQVGDKEIVTVEGLAGMESFIPFNRRSSMSVRPNALIAHLGLSFQQWRY